MSDDCSVKRLLSLSLLTEAHLSPRKGVPALNLPHLHLCTENKNSHDASVDSSTTTATTPESSASSFSTINASSCSASAEPTESPTSSTVWDLSSSSALDPPTSPVRIPARLRRKCPMYAQFQAREDHGGASAAAATPVVSTAVPGKDVGAAKIEPSFDQGTPPPTARTGPVIIMVPSPKRRAEQAAQRKRIPPPVPVPHLIKKSRGRRVPEPGEAQERAHVCSVPGCSKSFARAEHLKRHVISLHTHEKRRLRPSPSFLPSFWI